MVFIMCISLYIITLYTVWGKLLNIKDTLENSITNQSSATFLIFSVIVVIFL